jgi:hypothetical protein
MASQTTTSACDGPAGTLAPPSDSRVRRNDPEPGRGRVAEAPIDRRQLVEGDAAVVVDQLVQHRQVIERLEVSGGSGSPCAGAAPAYRPSAR